MRPKLIFWNWSVCIFAILPVGCRDKNQTHPSPPRPHAQANSTAQVPTTTTETVAAELRQVSDLSALLRRADAAKKDVTRRQADLASKLKDIAASIKDPRPWTFPREAAAIAELLKLIPLVRAEGKKLVEEKDALEKKFELFKDASKAASSSLAEAATLTRKFADEEKDSGLKEMYLDMAAQLRKLPPVYDKRASALEGPFQELMKRLAFVERSILFLDRLEEFLRLLQEPAERGKEIQEYVQRLNAYLVGFNEAVRGFRNLTQRIQESELSPLHDSSPAGVQPSDG